MSRWARRGIILLMSSDTGRTVAIGVGTGCLLAGASAGLVGTLLYGITPRDFSTLAVAVSVLALAALAAAFVPARRAASIDPVDVLRE